MRALGERKRAASGAGPGEVAHLSNDALRTLAVGMDLDMDDVLDAARAVGEIVAKAARAGHLTLESAVASAWMDGLFTSQLITI